MPVPSKGEEAAVRTAIIKFEQEFRRGPDEVRVFAVRDMLVALMGPDAGRTPIGQDRRRRRYGETVAPESHCPGPERLCEQVTDLIGAKITALFTDIDTVVGERIFVFTLEFDLEAAFR
ncbi:MAG: DUF2294 domain-containing protein [Nitrospira sp.]|nr:DUF2294 domain-containing protein [Nitrospira sp.]